MHFLGETSTGFTNKIKNILLAFAIYAVYILIFQKWMEFLWSSQMFFKEPPAKLVFFMTCVLAPISEEFIFRKGTIGLVRDKPNLMLPVVILSSALFGWLHYGAASLPIQGVFGFVVACLYIKNGFCYWSAVTLHFMWNLYCITILEKLN